MIESLAPVLVPVAVIAFGIAAVSMGWRVLRAYAVSGASEPLELVLPDSPARRRPSVDWSELVLVSLVLLNLGCALVFFGPFQLLNLAALVLLGVVWWRSFGPSVVTRRG